MVEKYNTLTNFIDDFFELITIMANERDNKDAKLIYKVPVNFYEKDSVLYHYHTFLTNYECDFVKKEIEKRHTICFLNYETTLTRCNCGFYTSVLLPCRYILRKREQQSMNMYEESFIINASS